MSLTPSERQLLRKSCVHQLSGFADSPLATSLRRIAQWSEEHAVEADTYGEGGLVAAFEQKLAGLIGKPAALLFPTGVMAQLVALRIWSERARLVRFGMHVTCHLENHEEQAYQALFGLHGVRVGERHRPIVAGDLEKIGELLACLLIELPQREIGGQLPSWDELTQLQRVARERGVALHMDGARLWESRVFYARSYAEIAAGFDSVYVSLYKGIGGYSGALLAGDESFIANARLWRRRMGGTLVQSSAVLASAASQFDERIAVMEACHARALTLAAALNTIAGIRTLPERPQVNMMHIHFDAPLERLLDARDSIARDEGIWLFGFLVAADTPGFCRTEIYVGDRLLEIDDSRVVPLFERLMEFACSR